MGFVNPKTEKTPRWHPPGFGFGYTMLCNFIVCFRIVIIAYIFFCCQVFDKNSVK